MHGCGLRRKLAIGGEGRFDAKAVSNFLLSPQCMRAYALAAYRFNPFAKDLGQNCRRYRVVTRLKDLIEIIFERQTQDALRSTISPL